MRAVLSKTHMAQYGVVASNLALRAAALWFSCLYAFIFMSTDAHVDLYAYVYPMCLCTFDCVHTSVCVFVYVAGRERGWGGRGKRGREGRGREGMSENLRGCALIHEDAKCTHVVLGLPHL